MAYAKDGFLTLSFGLVWSSSIVHIVTGTLLFFVHRNNCNVVDSRAGVIHYRKTHCQHPEGVYQRTGEV